MRTAEAVPSAATARDEGDDGVVVFDGPYHAPWDAAPRPGVQAGARWAIDVDSTIFPGSRTVHVYAPHGYARDRPAPFILFQDGDTYMLDRNLSRLIDDLVFDGKLPTLIAIFVDSTRDRSFEYDSVTDLYVRFVLDEVLPAVARLPLTLTSDPEGRAVCGHSSGGAAAFTMAWLRSDQFHRVLTTSGSFVDIRGAGAYPALIRRTWPPKPLRVFLSVGTSDLDPPTWWNANLGMASALREMGYHYRLMLLQGGHHDWLYSSSILPEALTWLWHDYVPAHSPVR